jgi:FtsH-binding integral membrane protein
MAFLLKARCPDANHLLCNAILANNNGSHGAIQRAHAMQSWIVLIVVLAVLVANIPAVMQQWRDDRPGVIKTLWLAGIYLVYVGLGIWLLLAVMAPVGARDASVLFAIGFLLAWVFYGALTLMRAVPRYREPPRWLMHFGIADIVLLGLLVGCLAGYLWV